MQFLSQYGMFLLQAATIVIAILIVLLGIVSIATRNKHKGKERLEVQKLNDKYQQMQLYLQETILPKSAFKALLKQEKKTNKTKQPTEARVFVIDFVGDMRASATQNLREEISAVLAVATSKDEVVIRLESPGGVVHGYGLAASQLQRVRDHQVPLTVVVDKVAASGGYMMACVANNIIAAPFAIIGSVGVVMQLPNFNRWLKKHNIDYEQVTSGEYKRTLTMFGENTEKDREKMQEDLDDVHTLFKDFIVQHRPQVDIAKISTGEYWFGIRAKELELVDSLQTSDAYLLDASKTKDIYVVKYSIKQSFGKRFALRAQQTVQELTNIF
ncbi:MAG: protease SohB [Gammaproteobacteria bacterium]|nr:protease SohB [Gammaproteobacteria bacterium]